jgi:phosphoesterase RecJ-like protein
MNKDIQLFKKYLSRADSCAIIGHVNPDGDAMGAALGMQRYIAICRPALRTRTQVILPNRYPNYFGWMDGAQQILIYNENKKSTTDFLRSCDLIICVDFNALYRIEELGKMILPMLAHKVLIDHHPQPSSDFDLLFSNPDACSTSEIVYNIIKAISRKPIMPLLAESLYTGIFTDTGGFSYNIKNPQVFRIVADLLETGINKDAIATRIFDSYSSHRMRLLGYALKDKMNIMEEHKTAYIALSQDELSAYHFETGDTEGFANIPLSIKNVELSGFFYENTDRSHIRVSLRTKGNRVSANDIARQYFNGGGHFNAAGGKFFGALQDCCSYFEDIVQKVFISIIFMLCVQCSQQEIKPHKAPVSFEKQNLQQANAYWNRREHDVITAYIRRQGLSMTADPRGFYIQKIKDGNGGILKNGSIVMLDAKIYLLDGTLCYHYDSQHPLQVTIGKEALISGLHAALEGHSAGTDMLLLFSSHLAFGLLGDSRMIPPQSPLICRIKILDFTQ